jgi:ABC-type iron transport system FetAB ATPase subunit
MKKNSDNRDELAALAMSAIAGVWVEHDKRNCRDIAETAYRIADAMIACKKDREHRIPSE